MSSEARLKDANDDIEEWERQLSSLRELLNIADARTDLKNTKIPQLEAQVKEQEAKIPSLSETAEKVSSLLNRISRNIAD